MTTSTTTFVTAPFRRMLLAQTRAELIAAFRIPIFTISTIAFPLIFYLFFGLPDAGSMLQGTIRAGFVLASLSAVGTLSVMLFSFGAGLAAERGQRMHVLIRATPLHPVAFLSAKLLTALAFALATLGPLFAAAVLLGGVRFAPGEWAGLVVAVLAGSIPFIFLGFAVGYLAGPNSAPVIINLLFLPLSFASGLFIPPQFLPEIVAMVAPYLPTYHYGQVVWASIGANTEPLWTSILWLLGYGAVFLLIAMRAYWREQNRQFG